MPGPDRVLLGRARLAGAIIGVAGGTAVAATLLLVPVGAPALETVRDVALLIAFAAVPFLMLAFWELGGLTPTPLAVIALGLGWIAAVAWCLAQLVYTARFVDVFFIFGSGPGLYALLTMGLFVIGLWIAGASLLAGPWLTTGLRLLGIVTGLAVTWAAIITGRSLFPTEPEFAHVVLLPIWALLLRRHLAPMAGTRGAERGDARDRT